jgi:hypothetical protein
MEQSSWVNSDRTPSAERGGARSECQIHWEKSYQHPQYFCIRRVYSVEKNIKFCYTENYATPRYGQAFVDWLVQKYEEDESFFNKTKQQFDQLKQGAV